MKYISTLLLGLSILCFVYLQHLKEKQNEQIRQINNKRIKLHSLLLKKYNAQATINLILINKMSEKQLNKLQTDTNYINLLDSL